MARANEGGGGGPLARGHRSAAHAGGWHYYTTEGTTVIGDTWTTRDKLPLALAIASALGLLAAGLLSLLG
jgi:hypothetical protein